MADANGHFIGQRAGRRRLEPAHRGGQRKPSAEHILVNRGGIRAIAGKAVDDLLDARAFVVALRAVRKRGDNADADDGPAFLRIDWTSGFGHMRIIKPAGNRRQL